MSRKGRNMKETTRGRSPSFPQKVELVQPNLPSILERIKSLTSQESGKVPIYCKHTVCSFLYARDPIIRPYDKAEPPRRSLDKLGPNCNAKSKKTIGPTKPKEVGKPPPRMKSKNVVNSLDKHVNGKKQTRQPAKGLKTKSTSVEKKPRVFDAHMSSNEGREILTHNEIPTLEYGINRHQDDENHDVLQREMETQESDTIPLLEPLDHIDEQGFLGILEVNTCAQEYELIDNIEHIDDLEINFQDHVDETIDVANDHEPCPEVVLDKENEQVVNNEVDFGSKDAEHLEYSNDLEHEKRKAIELEYEEPKPKRPGIEENISGEEVPKTEESTSDTVNQNRQVVSYGKKDSATCNRVIDETLSTLREQRRNRVKALVGAFENVISQ